MYPIRHFDSARRNIWTAIRQFYIVLRPFWNNNYNNNNNKNLKKTGQD